MLTVTRPFTVTGTAWPSRASSGRRPVAHAPTLLARGVCANRVVTWSHGHRRRRHGRRKVFLVMELLEGELLELRFGAIGAAAASLEVFAVAIGVLDVACISARGASCTATSSRTTVFVTLPARHAKLARLPVFARVREFGDLGVDVTSSGPRSARQPSWPRSRCTEPEERGSADDLWASVRYFTLPTRPVRDRGHHFQRVFVVNGRPPARSIGVVSPRIDPLLVSDRPVPPALTRSSAGRRASCKVAVRQLAAEGQPRRCPTCEPISPVRHGAVARH